jgi:hypothetical protein
VPPDEGKICGVVVEPGQQPPIGLAVARLTCRLAELALVRIIVTVAVCTSGAGEVEDRFAVPEGRFMVTVRAGDGGMCTYERERRLPIVSIHVIEHGQPRLLGVTSIARRTAWGRGEAAVVHVYVTGFARLRGWFRIAARSAREGQPDALVVTLAMTLDAGDFRMSTDQVKAGSIMIETLLESC